MLREFYQAVRRNEDIQDEMFVIRDHRYGGRIKLSRYGFGQAARTVDCVLKAT